MKCMKPKKVNEIPVGDFIYEVKYDGGSAEIIKQNGKIEIRHSGNPDLQNFKYPEIIRDMKAFKDGHYIAEIIVPDVENPGGNFPSFLKRQSNNRFVIERRASTHPVKLMVYDIVRTFQYPNNASISLMNEPLLTRKKLLTQNLHETNTIKVVPYYEDFRRIRNENNIEGIVIKKKDSVYVFDKRDNWYKFRFNKEETVKCVSYEPWASNDGILSGVVLTTEDGKRINLPGPRSEGAKQQIDDNGEVMLEISYNGKSDKGFRFTTVKRVLE